MTGPGSRHTGTGEGSASADNDGLHAPDLPLACPARPPCPGCPRYGDAELPRAPLRELERLAERYTGSALERFPGKAAGYRHRVRLSVRQYDGAPRLGIFEEGSHRLVPIARCPLHHPALIEVALGVESALGKYGILPYDESRHAGRVRAVQLVVAAEGRGPDAGLVQVTLVVREPSALDGQTDSAWADLLSEVESLRRIHSVWVNVQPERTNSLLGRRFALVSGPEFLRQDCGGAANFFPPGAFGQSNPSLHEQAVRAIGRFVPGGASVLEFHAGVGSIGLSLAASSDPPARLFQNEINPEGLRGLAEGHRALRSGITTATLAGPASAHLEVLDQVEVVIVDPPRKGLEPELLQRLLAKPPERLIYLSCGLDALLTESHALAQAGLIPVHIGAYAYFPFTQHIESLVVFDRTLSP